MARRLHRHELPCIAASAINAGAVVGFANGATESGGLAQNMAVVPVATFNVAPIGVALASAAQGGAVTVLDELNVVVVTAVGSVGHSGLVGVASTNGGVAPVAGTAGTVIYALGRAVSNAVAGEAVSVYVKPQQLSGNP